MTLANVKTALATRLDTITNIDTDHIFIDEPDTSPSNEQCPCFVVTLPRITPTMPVGGLVNVSYHFNILYLYTTYEQAQITKAVAGIDAYLSDVWGALFGALTLTAYATHQDFDGDVTRPLVKFRDVWYWGISVPWLVNETVTTAVTP